MRLKILVIDNNESDRIFLNQALTQDGDYEVIESNSAKDALLKIELHRPDCIILDYIMPDSDGIEFVKSLKKK